MTEFRVNGAPLDAGASTAAEILDLMAAQGWTVQSIDAGGEQIDAETLRTLTPPPARVDIVAALPPSTGEDPADRESILQGLRDTLPVFRAEAEQLGLAFARGEWRGSLDRLSRYLQDVEWVHTGFHSVSDLDPNVDEQLKRIPVLLREISEPLQRQSWVEVSDVLLYELVPYFEEWGKTEAS
ncbi:MAG: hypothetical protein AAF488_00580 [Planctomycetota bacterium]